MSDCMWEVGDTFEFVPTAYKRDNGSDYSKEYLTRGKVKATVVEINEERRWYRVEWTPEHDRPQHECFKF